MTIMPATSPEPESQPDPLSLLAEEALVRWAEERRFRVRNSVTPEQIALAFMVGNFCSAFLQTLGQRAGNGAGDGSKYMGNLIRKRVKRKGELKEVHIGVKDRAAAWIVITASTPDEARLALLDLDVTAEDVRGKTLRWDNEAMAWRADKAES